MTKTKEVWVNGKRHIATYDHGVLIKMTEVSDNNAESIKKSEATKGNTKVIWGNTSSTNAPKSDPRKREPTEDEYLIARVKSGKATRFETARLNARKKDMESGLSPYVSDDFNSVINDYNKLDNVKDDNQFNEIKNKAKKLRDDLDKYSKYHNLYGDDESRKAISDMSGIISSIDDEWGNFADFNAYKGARDTSNINTYAELRQKRALLQRKRGVDGYNTDKINSELEALDKYGFNQKVIDSMTDKDWENEKIRLQTARDYAGNKLNNLKTEKNTAATSTKYPDLNPQNKPRTEPEISSELKAAEKDFYYYNNLLSEITDLERITKIERNLSKKWGDYRKAVPLNRVLPLAPGTSGNTEYEAVNHSATYDGDSPVGKLQYNRDEVGIYSYMTDDEKGTYNYIYSQAPGKASEYLEDIKPILTKRKSQAESMDAYAFGRNHGVIGTAGSVLWNASAGLAGSIVNNVKNAFTAVSGKEIDPYDTRFQGNRNSQLVQQGVKDTIDSKVGKLIYSAGTQVAELALSMGVARGIGGAIGTAAKGVNAAQIANKASNIANQVLLSSKSMLDTTLRYKESGESDLAAVGMGMLSGLIEAYTERKSLSNLLKSPDIFKDMATKVKVGEWASKIGVDALKEGFEEVEANALNTIAALVFDYRDNDSFLSAIDKAKSEGKSDAEALTEAIKAVAPEYIESFVVGALAGGAFGVVNTASSINTVNKVMDMSASYFWENDTSRQSVEKLLIDMGYTDEAEIAKAANAIVRKGNGRSISKDNEALFEDDVRLRGMLHGYAIAVDAEARRDTVSEVLDKARETETPEATATSVPKNTTVTKPDAELTEEEIETRKEGYALINDDDADKSYRTRGRSGSKVYTYAVNKGGLIDELIKDGYSAEEARSKTEQLFRFMYNQGRINGNVDIAIKAASENIVPGYEAQAREFFVAGQMDAQGRLIGKTNARLVPNQTLKNMQKNGQINSLTVRAINALASKLGINIEFTDTIKDGEYGYFNKKTGRLMLSAKAKNKYFLTAVHESIHAIRTIHPESYNKLNEIVYEVLNSKKEVRNKAWNVIYNRYKKEATKDGKIDRDLINEELTAKVVSHLLTDESYIKELAKTNRKGLQRIYDAIVDFFDKIFKRYSEDASPRETEFKDALKELQGEFNTIKAMYENALKETTNVQQSKMVLPESINGVVELNNKVVAIEDNGDLLFNKEQWDTAGRDTLQKYLDSQVKDKEIDKSYAKQIMEFMDVMAKASDEMGVEYLHYNNWANYKIEKNENGAELTCVVKNGDYALNIDFSTKCVKRETLDAVINVLATKGLLDKVKNDTTAISVINQIIKKRKLDVACNLCFVDAKRQSVLKWANSFSDMWNAVIDLIVPKGEVVPDFGFSDTTGTRTSTVSTLTAPDFDNIEKRIPKKFKTAKGEVKPIVARIINALKADRNLIKHISTNDIASSLGLDLIKRNSETLYNIINSHQGSAKPKLTHGNVPYNNEVINRKFDAKAAFMVGGFRLQSFSDYVSSLFFDYMQTFAEFAAKKMPVHAYTKVMEFVKIFGKTGAKINMSGVPMVLVNDETAKKLSELYENGKKGSKFYNSALVKNLKKTAGLDENGDFIWASESIDIEEARKIAADKEYGKHCGIIAVGVSDAHIWKLLETPWIAQVIPYHRSGINTAAARMYNIDLFNDYTLKQNTKVKINGKWVSIHNKNVKVEDFDFYGELMKLGNAEDAHIQIANKYVDWCEQNGYLPKFADFVYKTVDGKKVRNENYYKLLADFRMADTYGKYSPQVAVQMNFPETDELLGYIRDGLKTEEARKNVVDKNVDSIVAEVREALDIEDDILHSKESTDDTSAENIDPGVQGTQAISDAAYFELKKEVQKKLDEHIKKYGAIKKGEDAVRDAQFPVQTSDDRYVRRFTRTAFEADSVTDEVAAEIAEEVANGSLWTTYSRITDKKSVDVALNRFNSVGYDKMLEEWEAKIASNERIEKGDIAKAMVLVQEAGKRGDMKTAMGLIAEIAAEGTRAGQLVQSLSLLKKLSGQANVYYIERTIKQIQKDIDDKYTGRKAKKHVTIKVPEDLLKKYREMYDREKKSGSQDHSGSDKILDDIMKNIAEQIPATWADKFNTWRYFAMLGNLRTHIRNLAGNTFFMPLILAKNMVAAIGEGLAAPAAKLFGKNMQRTKTLGGVLSFGGEYMRYGKKDAKKIEAMLRGEGKYSELQKIMQGRKIFTSKVSGFLKINQLVNANAKALDNEDWIFLKHNYARALTMYMKANKLSPDTITEKQLETARLYAVREAQKASFRDESALAKAIQRAEKSHKALGFAVGALMPFKQTPINVLKRGVEYSPAGVITTVGKGIKGVYEGKFSATEFIDGLGATLSGTALCYLGVYLASQGLLFGPGDDDEENRMNILNGIQNYSLKIGNGTYTIDWASPAAMSLFVGCEIWNSLANKEERTFADIVDALMSITEPVFEMSMLEGLMSVFEAGVYATRSSEAATEALTSIIPDYFSQFVPTTLGQIARTIDPVRRKTYVDKNKNVPEWLQSFGQQMAKKFPGTSFLLDPYVNAKGETELNAEGNIFSRAMQNFFSPGYYKSIKSNEVDSEISRLYEKFGSDANGVIPKTVGRKIGDVNLSSEQYTKYQQVTGQAYYSKLKEIISSDYYQNLSDTDKVRLLEKAREYAVEKGKEETLSDYHSSEGWLMKAFETDGLYRHVLNEVKEKFSEEDLVGDAREFYEEEKDKIFSDILAEYNPDKLDYELADKFYEDLYDLSEKIALEANSDGQYVIEDKWIINAKELEAEERAQYIYGRAILTQYDDQDKANDALQNDSFISDKVRGYLLQKSFGGNDNPSKLYSNYVARHSNEISFEEYTKLWEKWEAAEKYKVGNKTIDKKDQVLPEINKLKISNEAKSRIYDSFDWGNSEKALKNVPWSYVPDSQSPDVLSKRVGNTIANIKSSAYNNDADYGQCVWYARGRTKELLGKNIPSMGNANQMFANAKKNSKVEAKPENLKANMLVTYNKGTSTAGQYAGHVIYIEAVDGDTVYYSEGGSLKISGILRKATKDQIMKGITNDRKLGSDIIGFIDVTKY